MKIDRFQLLKLLPNPNPTPNCCACVIQYLYEKIYRNMFIASGLQKYMAS